MESRQRILVALDVGTLDEARRHADALYPYVGGFKIGMKLITKVGAPLLVREVRREGLQVMYDHKFCDIGDTLTDAAAEAAALRVDLFTVMACAGRDGLRKVAAAKGSSRALAVTVLTTFDDAECLRVFGGSVQQMVERFARDARSCGIDGIVCSAKDLGFIQGVVDMMRHAGTWNEDNDLSRLLKVTPGIRPAWAAANDQKRIATPASAVKAGSDYLVIGRPILQPPSEIGSPVEAAFRIADEIARAT